MEYANKILETTKVCLFKLLPFCSGISSNFHWTSASDYSQDVA